MSCIPEEAYVIIIGAMKSGTTSLYSYLVQHPEICECRIKEPEYFTQHQSHGVQEKKYEELWNFDETVHRYVLESSTGYTKYPLEKDIPAKISEYGIKPWFIYILRDPFERIESHFNAGRFNPEWKHSILDEHLISVSNYAVTDRIPRVYPWMNEPDGGMLNEWNMLRQHTASIICVTTLSGYASTGVGS